MSWRRSTLALLAVAALLAGCTGTPAPTVPITTGTAAGDAQVPSFPLAGTGCREGGGHSVHPRMLNPLPQPWMPADVLEDVGPQVVWSEFPDPTNPVVPRDGNTIGNYHATVVCDSWTFAGEDVGPMVFGFVGMKVQEPFFGDGVPVRQYLITVLAASEPSVVEALHAAGFHATPTTGIVAEEGSLLHTVLDTEGHGVYESYFLPKELGPMSDGVMRLWWQHENENGTFSPVALDMAHTPGGAHFGAEAQGYFSHLDTHDHDPVPGAVGHTAALAYTGFDRTFGFGPRPDVLLEEAYVHL